MRLRILSKTHITYFSHIISLPCPMYEHRRLHELSTGNFSVFITWAVDHQHLWLM